jgi:hypothetical protein
MGPLRRRDSTRARKARPAKSSTPPVPKGDVTRLKGIVKPPAQIRPEALKLLRVKLSIAVSVTNLCVVALEAQAADSDVDVAEVLRRYVSDPLSDHVAQLDRLIARGAT